MNILDHLPARLRKAIRLPTGAPTARPIDATQAPRAGERANAASDADRQQALMRGVSDTIEQALSAAGLMPRGAGSTPLAATTASPAARAHVVADPPSAPAPRDAKVPHGRGRPGEFTSHEFSSAAGSRTYKLYVPAGHAAGSAAPVPLLVMLHGCTQSPDDFAAGTRMNALADEHGFLVVYPAQAANANGSKCWNWFRTQDQGRDRGEPALIAGITREVAASHAVDARRIFVAGLSAGGAMAVILGNAYPELYAAVGAHSGLPYGAARDVMSAFSAMKGGSAATLPSPMGPAVPTIVFHGDGDTTVNLRNGAAIVQHAALAGAGLRASARVGTAEGGRSYSHTVHADGTGHPVVEDWVIHGAGHAWSGGSPRGSYTDAQGPDASAEMVRFFLAQQRAGSA